MKYSLLLIPALSALALAVPAPTYDKYDKSCASHKPYKHYDDDYKGCKAYNEDEWEYKLKCPWYEPKPKDCKKYKYDDYDEKYEKWKKEKYEKEKKEKEEKEKYEKKKKEKEEYEKKKKEKEEKEKYEKEKKYKEELEEKKKKLLCKIYHGWC